MRDTKTRLIGMWLRAMHPDNGLPGDTRAHLEHVLGNEYRYTPCRDCGEPTSKDRTHEKAA